MGWLAARWVAVALCVGGPGAMTGCSTAPEVKDTSGNPEVSSAKDADTLIGTKVRVLGEAKNAKLSAAVDADGWVVYLVDIRSWPDAIEGGRVEVTGILGKNDAMTTSGTPDETGTTEPIHVLRDASYLVLDD